jgi:DNA primase
VVQNEGAEAMRGLLDRSVALARFEVEVALERGDTRTTDGRDRALEQAADAIRPLPPSVLREELVQLVAGRLGLTDNLVAEALSAPRRPVRESRPGPPLRDGNGARAVLDRREQSERAFLAYCLALPEEGEERLAAADLDELFSAPETRRAAEYLRGRLRSPAGELPAGDEPLARLVSSPSSSSAPASSRRRRRSSSSRPCSSTFTTSTAGSPPPAPTATSASTTSPPSASRSSTPSAIV